MHSFIQTMCFSQLTFSEQNCSKIDNQVSCRLVGVFCYQVWDAESIIVVMVTSWCRFYPWRLTLSCSLAQCRDIKFDAPWHKNHFAEDVISVYYTCVCANFLLHGLKCDATHQVVLYTKRIQCKGIWCNTLYESEYATCL